LQTAASFLPLIRHFIHFLFASYLLLVYFFLLLIFCCLPDAGPLFFPWGFPHTGVKNSP
jgi:hypothetical protein